MGARSARRGAGGAAAVGEACVREGCAMPGCGGGGYLGSICGGWLFLLLVEGVVCLCCEVGVVREGFMRWLDVLLSKV